MMAAFLNSIDRFRAMRVRQTSRYRKATAAIPAALYSYWKQTAQSEFKGIPQDAFFFASAAEGLLTFFDCVRVSGRRCALPSAAADSVWHAWAKLDPAGLDAFCVKHYGDVIPHVAESEMGGHIEGALATCMVTARELERRDPVKPSVPRLFALDRKLGMPGGYGYQIVLGQVAYHRQGPDGEPIGKLAYSGGLMAAQLLAAGLITQAIYESSLKRPGNDAVAFGGAGAACGSSGCGDGGGAGCGAGCGGGGC